jgi:phospholipid/cholesterol/gamma-HCH transport system ATP-binding protein
VQELSELSDTSYIIAGGKVVASGELKNLKGHQSDIVNQFLNGLPDGPVPFHYPAADYYQQLLGSEA